MEQVGKVEVDQTEVLEAAISQFFNFWRDLGFEKEEAAAWRETEKKLSHLHESIEELCEEIYCDSFDLDFDDVKKNSRLCLATLKNFRKPKLKKSILL